MELYQIIIIVIISLILAGTSTCFFLRRINPNKFVYESKETIKSDGIVKFVNDGINNPYLCKVDNNGNIIDEPFKILVCSDMHNSTDESDFTFKVFERFLDKEKPDLVILDGDNVVGHVDTTMHKKLIKVFEDRNLYYGFTLGNHDPERRITEALKKMSNPSIKDIEEITAKYRKWAFEALADSKYCVATNYYQDKIFGSGNSVINIKNSKGITKSIFLFDSGDYVPGVKRKAYGTEKRCYSYIRESQLDWYKEKVKENTIENNGVTPESMSFFHIALPEFQKAFNLWKCGSKKVKLEYGNNYENVCGSDIDAGAFKVFKDNNMKVIVCGHDHKNDSQIIYQGVRLVFSQGLQFDGAYNRRKRYKSLKLMHKIGGKYDPYVSGVSIIEITKDGNLEFSARYAEQEGFYEGLEKGKNKALWIEK